MSEKDIVNAIDETIDEVVNEINKAIDSVVDEVINEVDQAINEEIDAVVARDRKRAHIFSWQERTAACRARGVGRGLNRLNRTRTRFHRRHRRV